MSDLQELASTKVVVPLSCSQHTKQIRSYSTIWDMTMGVDNIVTKELQGHVGDMDRVMPQIEDKFMDTAEKLTMGSSCALALVLEHYRDCPVRRIFTASPMPRSVLRPAKEKKRTPAYPTTATAPKLSKEKKERVMVKNTSPNVELMKRFKDSGKPIKELYQDTTVTKPFIDGKTSNCENQQCFRYHLEGECDDSCWWKASHCPQSATELSGFCQYLTEVGVPN